MSHSKSPKKETEGRDLFLKPLAWWTPPHPHCTGECLSRPDRYHPWDQKVLRGQTGGTRALPAAHPLQDLKSGRWVTDEPPRQAEIRPHQPAAPLPQAYCNSFIAPPKQSTEKQNDKPKLTSPSHSCICTHSPSLGQAPKHVLNTDVPWPWLLPLAELSPS